MRNLAKTIKENLIKFSYDEIDNGEYRMYLDDVSDKDWDYLFIRVEECGKSYPEIYITDHEDMDGHFKRADNVSDTIMIQLLNQMLVKKERKTTPIKEIVKKFHQGYDIPCNVAVPSIVPYLTDKCINSDKTWVGQVGLSGDDNGVYLSVFFPDKVDPAFSHDTPLEQLTPDELNVILDNLESEEADVVNTLKEMLEC